MEFIRAYDPYDLWAVPVLGKLKSGWSNKNPSSILAIPLIGIAEILAPITSRKLLSAPKNYFANSVALEYFYSTNNDRHQYLDLLVSLRSTDHGWGLPFAWYSKNGCYPPSLSFITHSLYPMEALLHMSRNLNASEAAFAFDAFKATWGFLQELRVMHQDKDCLALSYAPIDEPRIVVNANSYAAAAYALHAKNNDLIDSAIAAGRAAHIIKWVTSQQQADGSWFYYADNEPGNFIDCFHSCFVVKNLIKAQHQLPELYEQIQPAIELGWRYIRKYIYDEKHGLCNRFSQRSHRDPFRWDLYDQAEYLGLLVDFALYDEASEFIKRVERRFLKNGHWYCRIDILGRRWGKGFLRWGIAPFLYHKHRFQQLYVETH